VPGTRRNITPIGVNDNLSASADQAVLFEHGIKLDLPAAAGGSFLFVQAVNKRKFTPQTHFKSIKNAKRKAYRTKPLQTSISRHLIWSDTSQWKALRLHLALKAKTSGLIPVKRTKKQTVLRRSVCKMMDIKENTFYALVSHLTKLGYTHRDKFGNLCIKGDSRIQTEQAGIDWSQECDGAYYLDRVAVPINSLRSFKEFRLFMRSAQMTLEARNRIRNNKYHQRSSQEMAQCFSPLKELGLTWTTSKLESYMQDAYANEYFSHSTQLDVSSVSKIRKAAHKSGYIVSTNQKVRCSLPGNPRDPEALLLL